jgi:DNA-directed RNA polymerase alpha subunit
MRRVRRFEVFDPYTTLIMDVSGFHPILDKNDFPKVDKVVIDVILHRLGDNYEKAVILNYGLDGAEPMPKVNIAKRLTLHIDHLNRILDKSRKEILRQTDDIEHRLRNNDRSLNKPTADEIMPDFLSLVKEYGLNNWICFYQIPREGFDESDELNVRSYNVLKKYKLLNYERLCRKSQDEILKFRNSGEATVRNIRGHLHKLGMCLIDEHDPIMPYT